METDQIGYIVAGVAGLAWLASNAGGVVKWFTPAKVDRSGAEVSEAFDRLFQATSGSTQMRDSLIEAQSEYRRTAGPSKAGAE